MHKVKVKLSFECEMDLNPEYYEEGSTIEDMINTEKDNAKDDPYLYLDIMMGDGNGTMNIDIQGVDD